MAKKKWFLEMLIVVSAFALVFGGCASVLNLVSGVTEVETEESVSYMNAANDIVLEKDDGIPPDMFRMAFERKFPGLKISQLITGMKQVNFSHNGKNYRMSFTGNDGLNSNPPLTLITSFRRCVELQKKETK
jgi:hypothetical protein